MAEIIIFVWRIDHREIFSQASWKPTKLKNFERRRGGLACPTVHPNCSKQGRD